MIIIYLPEEVFRLGRKGIPRKHILNLDNRALDCTAEEWREEPAEKKLIKDLQYNDLRCWDGMTKGEALEQLENFDRSRDETL